jgi:hypothetical protein
MDFAWYVFVGVDAAPPGCATRSDVRFNVFERMLWFVIQ